MLKRMVGPRRIFKRLTVPIYNAEVWLIISDNPQAELSKLAKVFGEENINTKNINVIGACCEARVRGLYALIYKRSHLTADNITHEIFHLVHKILSWKLATEHPYHDAYHGEHGAMLFGYLMAQVCQEAKWPNDPTDPR